MASRQLCYGTCVALGGKAALLRGPSGSGKSDLALRVLWLPAPLLPADQALRLVADDQVWIEDTDGRLYATAPEPIKGKLEVRGIGLVQVEPLARAQLMMLVDLVKADQVERLPGPAPVERLLGIALPVHRISPFEASAAVKVVLMLTAADRSA